ncbi:hypothetical protein DRP05_14745 [Archaeoglobales archaeon]|nr:MAG: hypothetical protein DRP05_14745 [Archaeoglobales archaeon]
MVVFIPSPFESSLRRCRLFTFKVWINFKKNPSELEEITVYEIGPYILIHSHPRGFIKETVEAADFGF